MTVCKLQHLYRSDNILNFKIEIFDNELSLLKMICKIDFCFISICVMYVYNNFI